MCKKFSDAISAIPAMLVIAVPFGGVLMMP
jgi:hypothetical protein